MDIHLKLQQVTAGRQINRLEQKLYISPPIADSVDQVLANAATLASSKQEVELNKEVFDLVKKYVENQDRITRYTDKDIQEYLETLGYRLPLRMVSQARCKLDILPSRERY